MPFHFYVSYAAADYSEDLRGFFEDLSCTIRARLLRSGEEQVGFFHPQGIAAGAEWTAPVAEALRTSRTMIAMISPEYLRSVRAGKEWQVFEMRRELGQGRESAEAQGAIAPVVWIPCCNQTPKAISDADNDLDHLNGAYRQNGLRMLRTSLDRYQDEYVSTLVALADYVVEMASIVKLPPLDTLPPFTEVDNAFNPSYESSVAFKDEAKNGRYKAIVVERHHQVREMLVEYLRFSDFEVEGYEEVQQVPDRILEREPQTIPPDLFVVDLEFEARNREGLNLIEKIKTIKTRPAIMAMSASLSSENLIEAMKMGAEDVVPKPFDVFQVVERMKNLANIGRNRRVRPQGKSSSDSKDPSRRRRPVFLSYSGQDNKSKGVAAFLRSNIEARGIDVWYADDNPLPEGSAAAHFTLEAIDQAHVYLPLITEKYPSSNFCLAELVRFYSRVGTDGSRILLPVLHGSPETIENFEWIRPIIEEHPYADITSERFLDGLITLLGWIQKAVNQRAQS